MIMQIFKMINVKVLFQKEIIQSLDKGSFIYDVRFLGRQVKFGHPEKATKI